MTALRVQAFVKFFDEEIYADQFIMGQLYMRKMGYFQRLETTEADDARPDANEGVVSWHQPDRVELKIEMPGFAPIVIGKSNLGGPVSISRNLYSEMYLFCMTALGVPDPAELEGGHEEVQAQLQAAFQIDSRNERFGPFAVVTSADKLMPLLRRALRAYDDWYKADLVHYYDEKTFHGDFKLEDAPFRKQSKFSYQNEYRICLQTNIQGDEPFVFDIGDISTFAIKARSADLNAALKVSLRQPAD